MECEEAIKRRKLLLKRFIDQKDLHSYVEYKKARAEARKIISRKKRECFDDFCASINRFTSLTYVCNMMRIFKNTEKNIVWNKWKNKNRTEEIRKEIEKLAPPSVIRKMEERIVQEYKKKEIEEEFTKKELRKTMEMIRKNTAPGRDGIEYRILKLLPDMMQEILLDVYNRIWYGDKIPEEWREYQVIFIDKTGKEKVRPIALSSCVAKLMERLVNERLVWWAEKEQKLTEDQNGFRRGRSCAENLTKITTE